MTHLTHAMRRLHLLACCDDVSTHDDFAQLERAVSAQLDRLAAVLARQDGTDCIACC